MIKGDVSPPVMNSRYYDFNTYLRGRFGCRVQKITVDAGMTCPNRDGTLSVGGCIYCNARGSGTGAHEQGLSIARQIAGGKARLGKKYKARKFIAYFQAFSNTYAPVPVLKAIYEEALADEAVVGLSIGTRPDCVNEEILDLLEAYARNRLVWVEYGLQSAHDETLHKINRGHDFRAFADAVSATRSRGIPVCAHVILGLPGETEQHMMQTADALSDLGIDGLKLHLLYVVRGTVLEKWYQEGRFACMSRSQYVDAVCEFLARTPENVVIQRLTGDPHPQELVAPQWCLDKTETLHLIQKTLAERRSAAGDQGFGAPTGRAAG